MESRRTLAFYGTVIHAISSKQPLVMLEEAILIVKLGKVELLQSGISEDEARRIADSYQITDDSFMKLEPGDFLMPGFVDTHIHAPQYTNAGIGYDLSLLDWLKAYTFPCEAKFSDVNFAERVYSKVVERSLMHGTTTACYFATIHLESSLKLAEIMSKYGQRGFVGKVNMDQNSPEYYCETTEKSLADTELFIKTVMQKYGDTDSLITPCITPRFALSCTDDLLKGLSSLSKKYDVPIQTHMSENTDEVDAVRANNQVEEYVHVYENADLLTPKTILAHCVYSNKIELQVLKKYNCGIAHCPNSNMSLRSGLMDVRKAEEHDIKLGLGTDVSGGYSVSIQDNLRKSLEISKLLKVLNGPGYDCITYSDAFFLATLGGAQVMNLDDRIGNFLVGKEFDALVISPTCKDSPFDVFDMSTQSDMIQKFLFCGDDRNIKEIYIAGRKIELS